MTEKAKIETRDVILTISIRDSNGKARVSNIFRVAVPKYMRNKHVLEVFITFIGKRRK